MNDSRRPPFAVLPRNAAAAVLREAATDVVAERRARIGSEFHGQQAGVPGFGEAPVLVHEPGGAVVHDLLHPAFSIFEKMDRVLPEEGWFDPDLNPQSPIQFQLGAFKVPSGQALWLFDYQFQVYRPSGVDPGDFIPAAPGRFSNQLGFDVTVSGRREGNLSFQLVPQAVSLTRQAFAPPTGTGARTADQFARAAAGSFASTASPGNSLLPVRPNMQGPRGMPFTFVVGEGSVVALNVVIFKTVRAPISAIEGRQAGYLIQTNESDALINRVRPR